MKNKSFNEWYNLREQAPLHPGMTPQSKGQMGKELRTDIMQLPSNQAQAAFKLFKAFENLAQLDPEGIRPVLTKLAGYFSDDQNYQTEIRRLASRLAQMGKTLGKAAGRQMGETPQ